MSIQGVGEHQDIVNFRARVASFSKLNQSTTAVQSTLFDRIAEKIFRVPPTVGIL